ncbi:hypothetical protein Avbf_16126 [Armadillidium vulgare]|nr:hypothetical protein Avbf_16126 [Armadillidium vulgare]
MDLSRRNSEDLEGSLREASVVLLRERKILACYDLLFFLDTCQPGSVPDAQLAGAIIDLPGAPVVARAALLLEMAHFVHKCNRGAWPSWMKSSLPFYRPPSGPLVRGASAGVRRVSALQRAAGKMFYSWAEAIGTRLEEIFDEIVNVNPGGGDCPMALRMIAVQLLLEITAFLRETYPILPKSGRMSVRERPGAWHGTGSLGVSIRDNHTRRWSTTLSSMGPTHASAQSLHSVVEGQVGTEYFRRRQTKIYPKQIEVIFRKKSGGSFQEKIL